ncbi:hypothetical protein TA5114_00071 [Cognatishimia activa]|uniref:Uncharacterized protein n=1 Tax=Cognatishimia activa TaxID=1715691 RepID=A0A0P1IL79_9RHOB|nr:hypothetical protein TA5113_00103 [Cognatishimia activa]CUK24294.1 hypothetical protein TA5114_00071 [Cognatishimia activa]
MLPPLLTFLQTKTLSAKMLGDKGLFLPLRQFPAINPAHSGRILLPVAHEW